MPGKGFFNMNNKGFTLLELLVAATIIGTLAVFATISYKNSAADARMEGFKARADELAGAVQRFRLEYPVLSISGEMSASSTLVTEGFVGKGGWEKTYVTYYICKEDGTTSACSDTPVAKPLVCMLGNDSNWSAKLPSRYRDGYVYCVSETAKGEYLGS